MDYDRLSPGLSRDLTISESTNVPMVVKDIFHRRPTNNHFPILYRRIERTPHPAARPDAESLYCNGDTSLTSFRHYVWHGTQATITDIDNKSETRGRSSYHIQQRECKTSGAIKHETAPGIERNHTYRSHEPTASDRDTVCNMNVWGDGSR